MRPPPPLTTGQNLRRIRVPIFWREGPKFVVRAEPRPSLFPKLVVANARWLLRKHTATPNPLPQPQVFVPILIIDNQNSLTR